MNFKKSKKLSRTLTMSVLCAIVFGGVTVLPSKAEAATASSTNTLNGQTISLTAPANGSYSVSLGGSNTVVTDTASTTPPTYTGYSIGIGYGNTASNFASVAIGSTNTSSGSASVAMGNTSTASGDESFAVGLGSIASGEGSVAMGMMTNASGMSGVAFGWGLTDITSGTPDTTKGALGDGSFVTGGFASNTSTTFIGNPNTASGRNAVAMGEGNTASGVDSFAVGKGNSVSGSYSVAMGNISVANGDGSVAIGNKSVSSGAFSVAMGNESKAYGKGSVAFGGSYAGGTSTGASVGIIATTETYAFAAGYDSSASGKYSVAMGNASVASGLNSVALSGGTASAENAIALGGTASHVNSLALGSGSVTGGTYEISVGSSTQTRKITNVTAGTNATDAVNYSQLSTTNANVTTNTENIVANTTAINTNTTNISNLQTTVGGHTTSITKLNTNVTAIQGAVTTLQSDMTTLKGDSTTVGSVDYKIAQATNGLTTDVTNIKTYVTDSGLNANSKKITNVTAGTAANDAANFGQVQGYSTVKVGDNTVENTGSGIKFVAGNNVTISNSGNEIIISATGGGGGSGSGGETSTVMGKDSDASAEGSTSIGYNNIVSGKYSIAVGYKNTVSGKSSGAFGDQNNVSGNASYVVGNNNIVTGDYNFVLGNNVNTGSVKNSIVLGNESTVTEDNVVSVGSETNRRKIVNVAAGDISSVTSSDAVTGGQLYATNVQVATNKDAIAINATNIGKIQQYITDDGINANNKKITNVAAGTSAYDAVNYAQYSDFANNMERRFSKVNEDIGRTGAASAALASLHPQMMRKGESQVMAGMGRYHGKSGAAVGLAWQPHKRVMLSGGFADAAGEIMFNVGASYKFGQHSYTPEQLAEIYNGNGTPLYVAELNAVLKSKDVKINTIMADLRTKDAKINVLEAKLEKMEAMMVALMKAKK